MDLEDRLGCDLEASVDVGVEVLSLALGLPSVPGVESVPLVDDLGAGHVVGDVGIDQLAAGHVAVCPGAHAGVAPVVVVDLRKCGRGIFCE